MTRENGNSLKKNNADLLEGCRQGDFNSWEEVVRTYSPLVWTVARSHRLSFSDCEEIYQITWQRLFENISNIAHPERLGTWLTTVARRESIRYAGASKFMVNIQDPNQWDFYSISSEKSPEAHMLRCAENEIILEEMRRLPDDHQALVGMLFSDPPVPYEVISRSLGVPRGSIGPMRQRILRQLRESINSRIPVVEQR